MSKWPLRLLGDLCRQITVGFVGKMADQYVDAGVPFLRSQDILAGRIDVTRLKFISPDFHARIRKSRLVPGDVGIVRTGYPGTAAVVPDTLPEANCSDLVIARPGPDLEPRYLAFLLNSPWGKGMINGRLVGAAQQHFNVKVAKALKVPTPPIEDQRRIASILGAYDDLIEVNRRRVAILEEMVRGIFEEWFVGFRFPGHEEVLIVSTPNGLLPEGWKHSSLGSEFSIVLGGTPARKEPKYWGGEVPWINSGKANDLRIAVPSEYITLEGLRRSSTKIVRRQNIRHRLRRKLAECGPRLGVDVKRRACDVASADVRWSVA